MQKQALLSVDEQNLPNHASDSRKAELLKDPNVKRWYLNKLKRSAAVADVDLRRLGYFCTWAEITPAKYAKLPNMKMEDFALDFVNHLETTTSPRTGKKYAPTYIASCLKVIKSWAYWNRKRFERAVNISNINKRPSLESERVPTPDELRRVLYSDTTPLRTRAEIALTSFSGVRLECHGNYLGNDGLRIGDFPELEVKSSGVEFERIPTLIIIREELSKSRHWYPTFLCEEGCMILKEYLDKRIEEGEKLTKDSGIIITSSYGTKQFKNFKHFEDKSPFLRTINIGHHIREAMRSVGLPWRPYVFRSYFDTMELLAESKGLISHPYAQCFMGHAGDIEAVYTLRKRELPTEILEDMRSAYTRMAGLLSTIKRPSSEVEAYREKLMRDIKLNVEMLVDDPKEREQIMKHLASLKPDLSEDELMRKVREMLRDSASDPLLKWAKEPKSLEQVEVTTSKKRIISSEDDVQKYLDLGYAPKFEMKNGSVVMELEQ